MSRRFRFLRYIITSVGLMIVTCVFVLLCGRSDETINGAGLVTPVNCVRLKARISGVVEKTFVKAGEQVEAGQPLLALAAEEFEIEFEGARKNLMDARHALRQLEDELRLLTQGASLESPVGIQGLFQLRKRLHAAETELRRAHILYQEELISTQERDEARLAWELLQADYETLHRRLGMLKYQYLQRIASKKKEVELAERNLKVAKQKLGATQLLAPISGTVLTPDVEDMLGTAVMRGQTVLEIGDLDQMNFATYVSESDIAKVKVGQRARLFISAFPHRKYKVFKGTVAHISPKPELTERGVTFETCIKLDDPWVCVNPAKVFLRPGLSGKAEIITRTDVSLLERMFTRLTK